MKRLLTTFLLITVVLILAGRIAFADETPGSASKPVTPVPEASTVILSPVPNTAPAPIPVPVTPIPDVAPVPIPLPAESPPVPVDETPQPPN